jgi:hypothetical protein
LLGDLFVTLALEKQLDNPGLLGGQFQRLSHRGPQIGIEWHDGPRSCRRGRLYRL